MLLLFLIIVAIDVAITLNYSYHCFYYYLIIVSVVVIVVFNYSYCCCYYF